MREVPLFTISKSENRNLVQYSVRVDGLCRPAREAPVFAVWRLLEEGANRTAPILAREQGAYGVASQVVTELRPAGGELRLVLNALPERAIVVETTRASDGACRGYSTATIDGVRAHLYDVYVRLGRVFGVAYLLLSGWSLDGSHVVREKLKG
jgi:hypothetical protein